MTHPPISRSFLRSREALSPPLQSSPSSRSPRSPLEEVLRIQYGSPEVREYIEDHHSRLFNAVQRLTPRLSPEAVSDLHGPVFQASSSWKKGITVDVFSDGRGKFSRDSLLEALSLLGADHLRDAADFLRLGGANSVRLEFFATQNPRNGDLETIGFDFLLEHGENQRGNNQGNNRGNDQEDMDFRLVVVWHRSSRWKLRASVSSHLSR